MHKTLLAIGILTALFGAGLTVPGSAQMMCGPGQQMSSEAQGGMMCGMMGQQPQGDTTKPAEPQQRSGMCPCCRMMGMMGGGMGGQQPGMPQMQQQMPQQQ